MRISSLRLLLIGVMIMILAVGESTPTCPSATMQFEFPCPDSEIPRYQAGFTAIPPVVDGKLDESVWQQANRSDPFRDLIHGTKTRYDTRAAVLWDSEYLYVAYWIEEPNVTATLTKRDTQVWRDNDVELFVATDDGYYEFEINALATIYEVLFLWEDAYETHGYSRDPAFDRSQPKVRSFNGVGFKHHPRGKRIGFWNWDYPGLIKGVNVAGSLNDSRNQDTGWTVELALPWKGLQALDASHSRSIPPNNGDTWRMDFSRFNTDKEAPPATDSGGWAWSPHGVWDSHVPECFTYVEFVGK